MVQPQGIAATAVPTPHNAVQAAEHTEQRNVALLVAEAPGVDGDADPRGGQDGEQSRAGAHGVGRDG